MSKADLTEELYHRAALHGLEQKLRDAAALPKGTPDVEKWAEVVAVRDRLLSGDWNATKGGGGGFVGGVLFNALIRLYP